MDIVEDRSTISLKSKFYNSLGIIAI